MLSIPTQAAIAVLHDIFFNNDLWSAPFHLSEGEWKNIFDKLEAGKLIRLLPDKEPKILSSYELCRPLPNITLLDVLKTLDETIYCNVPTPESFYTNHGSIATKIGAVNQVARILLERIKISDW